MARPMGEAGAEECCSGKVAAASCLLRETLKFQLFCPPKEQLRIMATRGNEFP